MCPATPNVTCSPATVGPGRGLQLPACPSAARLQLLACSVTGNYNSRRALWREGCSSPVWREPRASLSPQPWPSGPLRIAAAAARPATRRRGPCSGGRSRFPLPSRAVSPPRRRWRPLTRSPFLWQGLGRRLAERRGRVQGTGECCTGLSPARGEGLSLRVPRVSAGTAVCSVSCWEFLLKGTLWVLIIYFPFTL